MPITGTSDDPCACCGDCVDVTIECRKRGGQAELCGYEEYTDISTPPKKYRRRTTDAFRYGCDASPKHAPPNCGIGNNQTGYLEEWGGYCEYDVDDCTEGNNTTYDFGDVRLTGLPCPTSIPTTPQAQPACGLMTPAISNAGTWVLDLLTPALTRLTQTWEIRTDCYETLTTDRTEKDGGWINTLSVEDTEDDAIARLMAGAEGTWSDWKAPGDEGCAGDPAECCIARYEAREAFTFDYQEAQWRASATGLMPGGNYTVLMDVYRRPFGSGSYSLFETLVLGVVADGSGEIEIEDDVPNERGYDTYVTPHACP